MGLYNRWMLSIRRYARAAPAVLRRDFFRGVKTQFGLSPNCGGEACPCGACSERQAERRCGRHKKACRMSFAWCKKLSVAFAPVHLALLASQVRVREKAIPARQECIVSAFVLPRPCLWSILALPHSLFHRVKRVSEWCGTAAKKPLSGYHAHQALRSVGRFWPNSGVLCISDMRP